MINARARGTTAAGAPFVPMAICRRDLRPYDVLIEISYCGICHTDIDHARHRWGKAYYPMVPGHEISGTVSAVGREVTRFEVGDRAGVGCMVDSCRVCEPCRQGLEQYCRQGHLLTYNAVDDEGAVTLGGYSERIVVDERYVIKLPDLISLERAAPLMCAGITVYSPLRRWNAGPGTRVGIVGLGGLGHLATQFSHALGAHTTVLDVAATKRHDALRLGADEFVVADDREALRARRASLDFIVCTATASVDLDAYLDLLDLDGTLVNVGVAEGARLSVSPFSLFHHRRSIAGSVIGSIAETQEMVDFCAEHGIGAEVEVVSVDEIDDAFDRVAGGDVRFRFVIDMATITGP